MHVFFKAFTFIYELRVLKFFGYFYLIIFVRVLVAETFEIYYSQIKNFKRSNLFKILQRHVSIRKSLNLFINQKLKLEQKWSPLLAPY